MKTIIATVFIVLLLFVGGGNVVVPEPVPITPKVFAEEEKSEPKLHCPLTLISDNSKCMSCHVMIGNQFGLKEFPPDAHIDYPMDTKIVDNEGLFFMFGEIDSTIYNRLFDAFEFFKNHNIDSVTIEIYSYGGDLFSAWRIKGLAEEWKASGRKLNTKVYGGAISAAAVLFGVGQERIVHAQAEIMFHELFTFKFFDVATPSDKEEEARVLRHLQSNITSWLSTRCSLTKEELDELMKKKEYWINGREAFEIGLATKLINH